MTTPFFDCSHCIEDYILAEARSYELNSCGQIFNEIDWQDSRRQAEVVDSVTIDRSIKEVFCLRYPLYVVVPGEGRPHQKRRQNYRGLIQENAPCAHHTGSVCE